MTSADWADVPDEFSKVHAAALAVIGDRRLTDALNRVLADDELAGKLAENPGATAEVLDLRLPEGLTVHPVGYGKPGPDWVPFTIRLTGCRTYYRIRDGKLEEAEICRGFEIVPNPVPGGPHG